MLDIVLFGATGYTGKLTAEYLVRNHLASGLRLGLAGRDRDKLEATRRELAAISPAAAELPLIVADSHDERALAAMVAQTRVVCTTVGPYGKYGETLVRCVAEAGRSYCDLTGETPWMHDMIARYHDLAVERGAKIVHTCGFDSIPSDLGCTLLNEHALRTHGRAARIVRFTLLRSRGGISGGTAASLMTVLEQVKDPHVRRVLFDAYALDPADGRRGVDGRDQLGVRYDEDLGRWTGPFVMAGVNTRVVRRSHALLGYPWGDDFSYAEAQSFGRGVRGFLQAGAFAAGWQLLSAALVLEPTRHFVAEAFLPAPGEGPDREAREAGFFEIALVGHGQNAAGTPFRSRVTVVGQQDPGYGETAKMLGESALCLARDGDLLPQRSGMLTPSTALGEALLTRLRGAGMRFEVEVEAD